MVVPRDVNVLCMMTNVHTLVQTMKLIDPVNMQKHDKHRAAFNGMLKYMYVAIGANRL